MASIPSPRSSLRRAAGRQDLDAAAREFVRELEQAFLVGYADERALDR